MRIVLYVIGVVFALGIAGFLFASIGLGDMKRMEIKDIDLGRIPDGTYAGRFQKVRWTYEVEVTVQDHQIVSVSPVGSMTGREERVVNAAAASMIANQSVADIDAVSGATVDTKGFQKAVENALQQALQQ